MTDLANPVPGRIQGNTEPWDGRSFRVTSTYQQHKASGRPLGIDFGNGRCGGDVYAMEGGTCSVVYDPGGAIIVRIKHAGLHSSGYAHLSMALVKGGQIVKKGQRIGLVGKTGADACHLHAGYTIGGREVDFFPWLNSEVEVDTVQVRYPVPRPYTAAKTGPLTGYSPNTGPKTVNYSAGSPFNSDGSVTVTPTPVGWAAGPYQLISSRELRGYYVPDSGLVAGPVPVVFTQAQLDSAVKAAEKDASRDVAEAAVDEAIKYGGNP